MAQNDQNTMNNNQNEIDLLRLGKALWHKVWIILIAGVLCAAMALLFVTVFVTPQYSSSVMLYVNSKADSSSNSNISSQDIAASRNLVNTYIVILESRATMEQLIRRTGVDYTYGQLQKMISAKTVNNTEVLSVTVTSPDPEEAAKLANEIAEILPKRVEEIVDGSSMRVVAGAEVNREKVSPSIPRYTLIGLLIGVVLACAVIVIRTLMDTTIHEDDDIFETLDIPVLTKIPDLYIRGSGKYKKYAYYSQSSKNKQE